MITKKTKTNMKSLYQRLKPEYKQMLSDNTVKYPSVCNELVHALQDKVSWFQLEVEEVSTLITFTDHSLYKLTASDIMYGDEFLQCED